MLPHMTEEALEMWLKLRILRWREDLCGPNLLTWVFKIWEPFSGWIKGSAVMEGESEKWDGSMRKMSRSFQVSQYRGLCARTKEGLLRVKGGALTNTQHGGRDLRPLTLIAAWIYSASAWMSKRVGSPLEATERSIECQRHNCSPLRPVPDFRSTEMQNNVRKLT